MKCQQCTFENIPGQKVCIKCGSTIELKIAVVDVHPPRMSKWKKPFRMFLRTARKIKLAPQEIAEVNCPLWLKKIFSDELLGLFLSVIPGLAHLLQRRFGQIKWYFLAWMILIISSLFMYGSSIGLFCVGLAIGLHTCIAVQNGILNVLENLREKIVVVILVLAALSLIYRFVPPMIVPDLRGSFVNVTVPYYKVAAGDYLLTWARFDRENLDRGTFVLIDPVTLRGYNEMRAWGARGSEVIVQIIARGHDRLMIKGNSFIVNGKKMDSDKYPVPQWLQNLEISTTIPDDTYFVSANYSVSGYGGQRLNQSYVLQVCLVKAENIKGRAFMRWLPLTKRGFIR